MQETKFLVALLENAPTSKQTSLQLLAAEHLYIPTLLPKLKAEATTDDYMPDHDGSESLREYDA
jgi:hypothetical protein